VIGAWLNVNCAHANSSCSQSAIDSANAWLVVHPVGSGVTANSKDWKAINPTYNTPVNYNEGQLCVPECRS
jgi:hypothetical protein